jgi:hypothetical protein
VAERFRRSRRADADHTSCVPPMAAANEDEYEYEDADADADENEYEDEAGVRPMLLVLVLVLSAVGVSRSTSSSWVTFWISHHTESWICASVQCVPGSRRSASSGSA